MTEKEKEKGSVPAGPEQPQGSGPASDAAQRTGARARARFKPDGRGPGVSEREGGDGRERLTGGARLSSLTLSLGGWRAHQR